MRFFLLLAVLVTGAMTGPSAEAQLVNHCRPDGAGGFICQPERVGAPDLTPKMIEQIRGIIRSQIPAIPYIMTPDEMTDQERNGGTATNAERAAQPGSQLQVCEDRLYKIGYSHVDQSNGCAGLSIHAPTPEQQVEFTKAKDAKDAARFSASEDAQRKRGEALRDKIAADRSK